MDGCAFYPSSLFLSVWTDGEAATPSIPPHRSVSDVVMVNTPEYGCLYSGSWSETDQTFSPFHIVAMETQGICTLPTLLISYEHCRIKQEQDTSEA